MIPAADLRKGNWVKSGETIAPVIEIGRSEVELLIKNNGQAKHVKVNYAMIDPIALTQELMAQCGFYRYELFPHRNAFHHKKVLLNLNFVGSICEVSYGLIAENLAIIYQRPLMLHQLQNLFYLLTNEELDVTF